MLPGFLDQSQLSNWFKCPAYWYERYVRKMGKPKDNYSFRDDAAAIGSLTHAGLEEFEKRTVIEVPQWCIEEIRPTPEALQQALELITAYAMHGEPIPWELKWFEEPLKKTIRYSRMVPAPSNVSLYGQEDAYWEEQNIYDLMAKVDFAFYVSEPTQIRIGAGTNQATETLQPGFWVQEYKTKSASRDRGQWMQEWVMKAQADFQLITLGEFAKTQNVDYQIARGVLVTVLEYEKQMAPKRKCRGCGQLQPFTAYIPQPDSTYRCMDCGHSSKLAPIKDKDIPPPEIWRVPIYRSDTHLKWAESNAIKAIIGMHEMVEGRGPAWDTNACTSFYGACDYLAAHQNDGQLADAQSGYVQIETMKYITQGKDEDV